MDDNKLTPADLVQRTTERWQATADILYVTQVTWLYVFAAIYPFMGIVYGVLLMAASVTPKAKRIGKICLILGIVNTALFIIAISLLFALGLAGALASLGD